jgi:hypothetical protein
MGIFPLFVSWFSDLAFLLALILAHALGLPSAAPAQADLTEGKKYGQSSHLQPTATIPVRLQSLLKGHHSGIREPLKIVIRTQDQWDGLYKRLSSAPTLPAPQIDFRTETVAGIFLGEKSTGGYGVEITRAEKKSSTLYLYFRETSPTQDQIVILALTQPYHLVKFPKHDADNVFLREDGLAK